MAEKSTLLSPPRKQPQSFFIVGRTQSYISWFLVGLCYIEWVDIHPQFFKLCNIAKPEQKSNKALAFSILIAADWQIFTIVGTLHSIKFWLDKLYVIWWNISCLMAPWVFTTLICFVYVWRLRSIVLEPKQFLASNFLVSATILDFSFQSLFLVATTANWTKKHFNIVY